VEKGSPVPAELTRELVADDAEVPRGFPEGFGAGEEERAATLVLISLLGIAPKRLHALAWAEGTASGCLAAIRSGAAGSRADRAFARAADPSAIAAAAAALGARFVTPADVEYVRPLLDLLADPPIGLFVKGRPLTGMPDVVAVVGARNCSSLGNEVAMDIGSALGAAGACVVSGAARGIDAAAHRGALAAGGTSIAVLGSGIDLPYPRGSAQLLERIAAVGAVVTEYAPGVKAEPFRFPARNRLVAALSRALVVVEGAEGSGSMISVEHALDLGRDVFAVPGTVTNPLAQVPLALIREGATLIRGADDLLADLGLAARLAVAPPPGLPDDERRIYQQMVEPLLPDALARRAGISIPAAVTALVSLEMKHLVRVVGGRYERRLSAPPPPADPP
jgi:DNA processing protein